MRYEDKESDVASETIRAAAVVPPHGVVDDAKLHRLIESMERDGWTGRPIVAQAVGDGYAAWTGSHRLAAANKLDIEVPVVLVPEEAIDRLRAQVGILDYAGVPSRLDDIGRSEIARLIAGVEGVEDVIALLFEEE